MSFWAPSDLPFLPFLPVIFENGRPRACARRGISNFRVRRAPSTLRSNVGGLEHAQGHAHEVLAKLFGLE